MSAERVAVVQIVVRFEVAGPHLTDGLSLAGRIASDAFGLPYSLDQAESRTAEAFGDTYTVTAASTVEVAAYPKHGGWMPEWTKE